MDNLEFTLNLWVEVVGRCQALGITDPADQRAIFNAAAARILASSLQPWAWTTIIPRMG